ncbi:MAG TPA: hypothetical protein PLK30_13290 [Blastocatellia bacterium]|nr:hypothetical protein [Blastocatellia bacterium]
MNSPVNQLHTCIRLLLLAVCMALPAAAQNNNQWRPLALLEGGTVNALLGKDGVVYAGTSTTGIFASTDNGKTWSSANNGLGNLAINALVTVNGTLLAATDSGIYRSSNGGQNWTLAGLKNQQLVSLAVANLDVFAGSSFSRVYRSSDNGQSWVERGRVSLLGSPATAITLIGDTLIAGTSFGVFRSTNQGQSWTQVTTGLPNVGYVEVGALLINGNTIYLGCGHPYDNGVSFLPQVYSSNDNGQTWTAVGSAITATLNSTIADAPGIKSLNFDGTTLIAMTDYGVFTFNGQVWQESKSGNGFPVGMRVKALVRSGGTTLAGTEGGIFVATDQGWNPSNAGLTAASISALAVSGNAIIASAGASGLFRSGNEGQSWSAITSIINSNGRRFMVKTLAARGNTIMAGADWGGIFRSTDNGTTWSQLNAGLRFVIFAPDIAFSGPAETDPVYALSWGFVHRLSEDGKGWKVLFEDAGQLYPFNSRIAASGSNVFVSTTRYVVRSTDGGINYNTVNSSASIISAQCILAQGNQVLFGGQAYNPNVGSDNRIFVSTDKGGSFTLSRSLIAANALAFSNDTLYAATSANGIYFSKNQGSNWTPINAGLLTRSITALAVNGEMLLAGTNGRGVYVATTPYLQPANLINLSAASYNAEPVLAAGSIVSAFGTALATDAIAASTTPLPGALQGTRVLVRDSTGTELLAPLFYVSPSQINYQIPTNIALGEATIMVVSGDGSSAFGKVQIVPVAPGLFAANSNGQGVPAAQLLRIKANGTQSYEPVAQFDAVQNRFKAVPIDMGAETDQVFLILYGTGIRGRSSLTATTVAVGGTDASVIFAGAQGDYVGLDQINVLLPRSLAGRGDVDVVLKVDGQAANIVRVNIK